MTKKINGTILRVGSRGEPASAALVLRVWREGRVVKHPLTSFAELQQYGGDVSYRRKVFADWPRHYEGDSPVQNGDSILFDTRDMPECPPEGYDISGVEPYPHEHLEITIQVPQPEG